MSSLESLKDELQLVAEKKTELERRLQLSVRERDSLNAALEEASDRIHSLERHAREQETKLQVCVCHFKPFESAAPLLFDCNLQPTAPPLTD